MEIHGWSHLYNIKEYEKTDFNFDIRTTDICLLR